MAVSACVLLSVRTHAAQAHPFEACGLLLGSVEEGAMRISSAVEARNVHPTPRTHFEIDPKALINAYRAERQGGPVVMGHYHSHPTGDPRPSRIDAAGAPGDGLIWAICAGGRVEFWKDEADGFEALSYSRFDP
ncbi:MAG: M67 family metallopeptidase [Pseudomonadota bacterium]